MQNTIPVMRRTIVAALSVVSAGCTGRAVQLAPTVGSASSQAVIDSVVERGRGEIALPGVSLAIMRGNALVLAKGYGFADRAAGTPATAQTIYAVGSLSKQFTAGAIMKLVEAGRLRLDEPITKYLPSFRAAQAPVPTIRNLLLQNSGLPEWDELPEMQDIDGGDPSRFELSRMIDAIARQQPLYRPGDWWSYSNSNYTVLAAVIERASGVSYDEYLARIFFEPLGLRSTGGCASARVARSGRRATGYQDNNSYALRPLTAIKARAHTGSGGLCSNAVDLAMWMRALVDGSAVSVNSFRQMTTAVAVRAGFTPPYGFGLSMLPLVGQRAIWHGGVLAGYTAVLAYLPDQDLIISMVANARHAWLDAVVKDIARELIGLPTPGVRDLPIAPLEAERVTGNYDDGMFKFRVFRAGAQLFLDVPQFGTPMRLLYQGRHDFATARPEDFRLRFEPDTGAVERVVWEWAELRAYGRRAR
jgi:D-alanyl-D-alanine carboxypeptidase